MKHARKLASLLLALVMVFALATTAFATEPEGTTTTPTTGSITVDNPVADRTYTAYKILMSSMTQTGQTVTILTPLRAPANGLKLSKPMLMERIAA